MFQQSVGVKRGYWCGLDGLNTVAGLTGQQLLANKCKNVPTSQ